MKRRKLLILFLFIVLFCLGIVTFVVLLAWIYKGQVLLAKNLFFINNVTSNKASLVSFSNSISGDASTKIFDHDGLPIGEIPSSLKSESNYTINFKEKKVLEGNSPSPLFPSDVIKLFTVSDIIKNNLLSFNQLSIDEVELNDSLYWHYKITLDDNQSLIKKVIEESILKTVSELQTNNIQITFTDNPFLEIYIDKKTNLISQVSLQFPGSITILYDTVVAVDQSEKALNVEYVATGFFILNKFEFTEVTDSEFSSFYLVEDYIKYLLGYFSF